MFQHWHDVLIATLSGFQLLSELTYHIDVNSSDSSTKLLYYECRYEHWINKLITEGDLSPQADYRSLRGEPPASGLYYTVIWGCSQVDKPVFERGTVQPQVLYSYMRELAALRWSNQFSRGETPALSEIWSILVYVGLKTHWPDLWKVVAWFDPSVNHSD